jgi:hypothetical protein
MGALVCQKIKKPLGLACSSVAVSARIPREVDIARAVAEKLRQLGLEPWIASEEQTLDGVKEHIFETLANSEYLIFVDFKR